MVWRRIHLHGRTPLHLLQGNLTGVRYMDEIVWPTHTFSGIVVGQSEAGFICEQYPAPLLSCPGLLTSAPCSTSMTMGWGQRQANNRYL